MICCKFRMRGMLAAVLAVGLAVGLAACGKDGAPVPPSKKLSAYFESNATDNL